MRIGERNKSAVTSRRGAARSANSQNVWRAARDPRHRSLSGLGRGTRHSTRRHIVARRAYEPRARSVPTSSHTTPSMPTSGGSAHGASGDARNAGRDRRRNAPNKTQTVRDERRWETGAGDSVLQGRSGHPLLHEPIASVALNARSSRCAEGVYAWRIRREGGSPPSLIL